MINKVSLRDENNSLRDQMIQALNSYQGEIQFELLDYDVPEDGPAELVLRRRAILEAIRRLRM